MLVFCLFVCLGMSDRSICDGIFLLPDMVGRMLHVVYGRKLWARKQNIDSNLDSVGDFVCSVGANCNNFRIALALLSVIIII